MRRMMMKSLVALAMMLVVMPAGAQISADDMLARRCAEKVKQMCDNIEYMSNPQNKEANRKYYKGVALNLFIESGNSYEEDGRTREGVTMETTSVNRKTKNVELMREYFDRIIARDFYSRVDMKTTDVAAMKVSNLQRIDDNKYVCTVYFEQAFTGYRDGRPVYRDITRKCVKCYVIAEQTEDDVEFIVLLGDVTALETRRA